MAFLRHFLCISSIFCSKISEFHLNDTWIATSRRSQDFPNRGYTPGGDLGPREWLREARRSRRAWGFGCLGRSQTKMETLWKHNHYHHLSIIYHHLSHDMFIMLSLSPLSIINHYHTLSSWHMFVSFLDVLEYISWTESCLNMPLRLHSFECKPFLPWHIAYFVQHV